MVSISDTTLPGVSGTVDSGNSTTTTVNSPGAVALVGGADPTADATAGEAYRVTNSIQAGRLFGADSMLGRNVQDALAGGAGPVYAAAAEPVDVTAEDLSGLGSTTGSLSEAPVVEDASNATFTVDSTELTTILTLEDPSTKSPGAEEVYLRASTGDFELGTAPATSGEVDYTYEDYTTATSDVSSEYGNLIDLLGCVTENAAVVDSLRAQAENDSESKKHYVVVAGAASYIPSTQDYANPQDTSRLQLTYPPRRPDGYSNVGSYMGLRAGIGIQSSAMKKTLAGVPSLYHDLSRQEMKDLDGENVVVFEASANGAVVANDPTCVTDSNTDESNVRDGLSRLILDYVTEIVFTVSQPYVGEYNDQGTRNHLDSVLNMRIKRLQETNVVQDFNLYIEEVDAYTAKVYLGVETAKPLRNIVADIAAGDVTSSLA